MRESSAGQRQRQSQLQFPQPPFEQVPAGFLRQPLAHETIERLTYLLAQIWGAVFHGVHYGSVGETVCPPGCQASRWGATARLRRMGGALARVAPAH